MAKKKSNNMKQKNKAKHKKDSSVKKKMTKCVILYGNPNKGKRNMLKKQQELYTNALNYYIDFLYNIENYDVETFISILNNSKKSPLLRSIEKNLRPNTKLKSAFSQEAFDEAVNKVSTQFINIKNEMYSYNKSDLVSSKVLFSMAIYGYSKDKMSIKINDLKLRKENLLAAETDDSERKKLIKDIDFYLNLNNSLSQVSDSEFEFEMSEFFVWYEVISSAYKKPFCKNAFVKMSSSTCKLEKSTQIKEPYVLRVTSPYTSTKIEIPLQTSGRSLSRMERYQVGTSMSYSIRDDGSIRVNVYVKKEIDFPQNTAPIYVGVDTGITDTFHTSDGLKIGGSSEIEKFYKNEVEPAFAELNQLRQKKKKLKEYLHQHKNELSDIQIKQFRDKMDHIENNIRKNKKAKRLRNRYHDLNNQLISKSCGEYIKSLNNKKETITVLEKLDIKNFDKSKHDNSLHSLFIRGKLQKRLMEQLNWNGYQFIEVEPAYTSQVCPICYNLNPKNRDNKSFKCTCCGHEDDADHVGAVNIKFRAEDKEILNVCKKYKYQQRERHKQIKLIYEERHKQYQKVV